MTRLRREWTTACATAETMGIGIAGAAAGLLVLTIGEPQSGAEAAAVLAVMVAAGALEGALLGWLQWRVLRRRFPSLPPRSWIGVTAAVAALGWLVGMLPSTVRAPDTWASVPTLELGIGVVLALSVAFGLAAGALFGAAQWLVLRRHARDARSWILANALGWATALPWIFLSASAPVFDAGFAATAALAAASGAAAGLSLGAITGAFLYRSSPLGVEGGLMLCRDLMKTSVARCAEELSVEACARMMRDNNLGFLPVVDGRGQVTGVVTDRDLAVRVLADDLPSETPVGDVMTRDVRVCRFDDDIESAERKMALARKSRLVVTDDGGRCVGVISLSDVAQAETGARAGDVLRAVTRREAPAHVVLS